MPLVTPVSSQLLKVSRSASLCECLSEYELPGSLTAPSLHLPPCVSLLRCQIPMTLSKTVTDYGWVFLTVVWACRVAPAMGWVCLGVISGCVLACIKGDTRPARAVSILSSCSWDRQSLHNVCAGSTAGAEERRAVWCAGGMSHQPVGGGADHHSLQELTLTILEHLTSIAAVPVAV